MYLKSILNIIVLLIITGLGLYIGTIGFIREDLKERIVKADQLPVDSVCIEGTKYINLEKAEAILEFAELRSKYGDWVTDFPELAMLFITAIIFGGLGGVTRSVHMLAKKQLQSYDFNLLINPFLGVFMGLLTLGLSYLIPTIFSSDSTEIRRTTLICFALFAGLFSDQFIQSIEKRFLNLINKTNENENNN
ncbi:MAG: hypothetical protein AAGG59_12330 [Bacteroidota bacterium]